MHLCRWCRSCSLPVSWYFFGKYFNSARYVFKNKTLYTDSCTNTTCSWFQTCYSDNGVTCNCGLTKKHAAILGNKVACMRQSQKNGVPTSGPPTTNLIRNYIDIKCGDEDICAIAASIDKLETSRDFLYWGKCQGKS